MIQFGLENEHRLQSAKELSEEETSYSWRDSTAHNDERGLLASGYCCESHHDSADRLSSGDEITEQLE